MMFIQHPRIRLPSKSLRAMRVTMKDSYRRNDWNSYQKDCSYFSRPSVMISSLQFLQSLNLFFYYNLMSDFITIKLRNSERLAKKQRKRQTWDHLTPPKYIDKRSLLNTYNRLQKKMGYDYECEDVRALKWMKEEFQEKMVKYLGQKQFAQKKSRMDKVQMKEELKFKPGMNPFVKLFTRVNGVVEKGLLWDAFCLLKK